MRAILPLIAGLSLAALLNACSPDSAPSQRAPEAAPAAAAAETPDGIDARGAAEQFYTMHVQAHTRGTPDTTQMALYRPFLSQALMARLEEAAQQRAQAVAEHPDEKPPFDDGDLFCSLYEGATSFEVGVPVASKDGQVRVPINFSYSETGSPTERWTDLAVMIHEDGGWKLADVVYGGDWDFAATRSLSHTLEN